MVTQKEIAEKLGISRTTVARAINGSPLIKEETKKKILELVKETNYEKNYVGSSLAGKKTKKVCALVVHFGKHLLGDYSSEAFVNMKDYKKGN